MTKILANDGVTAGCKEALENAGFEVSTENVPQENLNAELLNYDVVLVRSATKVRKETIDACPNLKMIGRGGVGMDNIDVEYAREKGIEVINTPAASSGSVGELVFAHLFSMSRFLPDSNRNMPLEGDTRFKDLKKKYAKGRELRGKTLGIIGIGRIGQATANIALGVGMKVIATDPYIDEVTINVNVNGQSVAVEINTIDFKKLLKQSDYISIHVPGGDKPVINSKEFKLMKDGVGIVNCARGGVIDEGALLDALESGKLAYAGLDVFENEPTPSMKLLMQEQISLTPHIGAATLEAQDRIGMELAEKIIAFFRN
ncbi:MAG: D-2-hydroxyacid dehydrogenase [Flavobacteriales bacterium]|nr:D-2-hydroxyacid dehydrogenase [Flavobacteriales bacterium]